MPPEQLPEFTREVVKKIVELDKVKGVQAVATSLDVTSTSFINKRYMAGEVDVEELYASRKRGLERLLGELSEVSEDKLMAAHLANYIHRLQRTKEDRPEKYEEILQRVAGNVDNASYLSEEQQRQLGGKVKSPWKTTRDLQLWLDAQVIAKQREEQQEREKRLAAVTAVFDAAPVQGKKPLRIRFDASGSQGEIQRFSWDFGDERGAEGMIVDHIYPSQGDFDATLTVHSAYGSKHTSRQTIAVTGEQAVVGVRVGVSPKQAKAGDLLQIAVNPQVTGLEQGQLKIAVAVDGKRIAQKSRAGFLKGDLAQSFQYLVPAGLAGGIMWWKWLRRFGRPTRTSGSPRCRATPSRSRVTQ